MIDYVKLRIRSKIKLKSLINNLLVIIKKIEIRE